MLYPKNIPTKTYEELLAENLGKISIYADEWTNYNPADPGITTLENLTALQMIQQNQIEKIPRAVSVRLLELLGYRQQRQKSATVYLEADGKTAFEIPAGQRFMAGELSFETTRAVRMGAGCITGVFCSTEDGLTDFGQILDGSVSMCAAVFGKKAEENAALWLVMDEPPKEGEEKILYAKVEESEGRTPFSDQEEFSFAKICWECSTEDGFVPMRVEDGTHGFLADGYLRLTQPKGCKAARVEADGISGYVWRARLVQNEYDAPPVLRYLSGFLFPVQQKETKAAIHSFQQPFPAVISEETMKNGYIRVYVREQKACSYVIYEESTGKDDRGRYYRKERIDQGRYAIVFDRKRFGCAPGRFRDAVKIVVYSEEMMQEYCLGNVYGFDEQEIRLPGEHVVLSDFCVIAGRVMPDGETVYDFLRPGRQSGQEMYFSLDESEGKLVIHDPGSYVGAKLYLGSIAVTLGPEGNVRAGNVFTPVQRFCGREIRFYNPAPGRGGAYAESFEQMRKRVVRQLNRAETAVTPADYETLVRRIPGLCIKKVHAWMDHEKNEVQIAVLPGSREAFPQLSEKYQLAIKAWLDARRLLSTVVRIRQPVYAAVSVSGTIYVKPHYEGSRKQIEEALLFGLDYVHGSMGFGERLRFDRIFHEVERLDCVSYIHELVVSSPGGAHVAMDGADMIPAPDCLLYPGRIKLDILPQQGGR